MQQHLMDDVQQVFEKSLATYQEAQRVLAVGNHHHHASGWHVSIACIALFPASRDSPYDWRTTVGQAALSNSRNDEQRRSRACVGTPCICIRKGAEKPSRIVGVTEQHLGQGIQVLGTKKRPERR